MLLNLHVKNLALIEEIEVDFREHLNILTGETGAGKSIIIGSVNAALGGKISKEMVRDTQKEAVIELLFQIDDHAVIDQFKKMEIDVSEDKQILITRKIINGRGICKINDATVTLGKIKEIAGYLIDIHGQHEHQSLLNRNKHLEILDHYSGADAAKLKGQISSLFNQYIDLNSALEEKLMDEEKRVRELNFTAYEIKEIEDADLKNGEDEDLNAQYKKMSNAKEITQNLMNVHDLTGYDNNTAGDYIGRALRQMAGIHETDEETVLLKEQLETIDSLLNDFNRDISEYLQDITFEEETFKEVEERLNLINGLKVKYGSTVEKIQTYLNELKVKYTQLKDYEAFKQKLLKEKKQMEETLHILCSELSSLRKKSAKNLCEQIKGALIDLNFLDVEFDMKFEQMDHFSKNGFDQAYFVISTNPGEKMRPLNEVASGGELSRIMLAIKSVLADVDAIDTLIFDEIDVGISGRTAQKVSERLFEIAKKHQVICITHLAQIAAMAGTHYKIEKNVKDNKTVTTIVPLDYENSVLELARITGGVKITDQVIKSAREMKELAKGSKLY